MKKNPSRFRESRRPVEGVCWFRAVDFCNRLSQREKLPPYYLIDENNDMVEIIGGCGYRLPTEAEWEYACRAETISKWSFGDDASVLHRYAWFRQENVTEETRRVGEKGANPWGLHDMHGNVLEWCWDWHREDYYRQFPVGEPTADPMGPIAGLHRVVRGGSYKSGPVSTRSASRDYLRPRSEENDNGFRVARTPDTAGT